MTRLERTIFVCVVVGLAAWLLSVGVTEASAHPLKRNHPASFPGLHWVKCHSWSDCKEAPPKPGPQDPCTEAKHGTVVKVWDEKLSAFVEWQCRCWEGDCRWYRVRIVQRPKLPWERYRYRFVFDWQRACDSIVCLKTAEVHRYPTKRAWLFWSGPPR